MDAVVYLMYERKMCEEYLCEDCPIGRRADEKSYSCADLKKFYPAEVVRIVEEWSKDNPLPTNRRKYEEVFGVAPNPSVCPPHLHCEDCDADCSVCLEWWDEPYEEPECEE